MFGDPDDGIIALTEGIGHGFTVNPPIFFTAFPSGLVRVIFHFPEGTSAGRLIVPSIVVELTGAVIVALTGVDAPFVKLTITPAWKFDPVSLKLVVLFLYPELGVIEENEGFFEVILNPFGRIPV